MMTETGLILITGASGKTGRKVVQALAARGAKVRAFFRNADYTESIAALGVKEITIGDLFDDEALDRAVAGTDQVFHICPPMNPGEADLAQTVTGLCLKHDVRRLILWSVLHPLLDDVRHHDLKLKAERHLVNSGQTYTILQPGRYMQHLVPIWDEVMATGSHAMPFSVDEKFSLADLDDLAEAGAIIATEPGHEGATYQLAGPQALSQTDMAHIISDITGRTVTAARKTEQAFRAGAQKMGLPAGRIEQICKMNAHYDKHGLIGNSNILQFILGRVPTTFAEFIARDLVKQNKDTEK
jgi:uncharacterized protein YbjT (DUF2867 family)